MRYTLALVLAFAAATVSMAAEDTQKLIDTLKSAAPPAEKAMACKRLAVYGDKEAIPALAPLLADPELASWARIALEMIPDPAANDALRDALGKLQGRLLIGTINSLAVRRDPKAVSPLIAKLGDADADVASAAAVALGHIGGDASVKALMPLLTSAPASVRPAVGEGCIRLAERALADGKSADAVKLYDAVRNANISKQKTVEGIRGAILARKADGIPLLVELLRSPDKKLFNMGLRVARELPERGVTKVLLTELDRSAPDRQSYFLLALADRGDTEALPAALKAAKSGPAAQRIVAIGVLERLGNPSCIPVLLAAAAEDDAELSQAAKTTLVRMTGADVDKAIVDLLNDRDPKTRRLAIDLVTQRRTPGVVPALLKGAQGADEEVRLVSLKALGDLADTDELPAIVNVLVKSETPAQIQAAESAVTSICTRNAKPVTGKVVITKAVYGDLPDGKQADVTKKVAGMVKAGNLTIEASNSNFGDTAGGVVKKLRVDYSVDGQANSKTVGENDTITIAATMVSPACSDAVFAALPKAPTNPKLALLRILRSMGGPRALEAVRAAANDANAEVKDTALRALCDWPNTDALPDLAQMAKTSTNPTFKILALRGYIRLIGQQEAPADQELASLKDAWALAARTEEKRLVLAALGNVPSVDALALVTEQLASPDLKDEASAAAVAIAEKIAKSNPAQVADAMQKVAGATTNKNVIKRAKDLLGQVK